MKTKADKMTWMGRGLTLLAVLPFFPSAIMKFLRTPEMLKGWSHLGWPESMITTIAVLEVISVALYLIPQLSVLGAILLTGYIGGAISTHLRMGEGVAIHVVLGIFIWAGLFLREPRLRAILPIRKPSA